MLFGSVTSLLVSMVLKLWRKQAGRRKCKPTRWRWKINNGKVWHDFIFPYPLKCLHAWNGQIPKSHRISFIVWYSFTSNQNCKKLIQTLTSLNVVDRWGLTTKLYREPMGCIQLSSCGIFIFRSWALPGKEKLCSSIVSCTVLSSSTWNPPVVLDYNLHSPTSSCTVWYSMVKWEL